MLRRRVLALALSLPVLLACAPAASAHDEGVVDHGDRIPSGADAQLRAELARGALTRVAAIRVDAPRLADSWCGNEAPADGAAGQPDGPTIKVVYAHPADVPDRFGQYADLIESDMRGVTDAVLAASGGSRSVRFDVGTACGANYVDVTSVALPLTRAQYLAIGLDARADRIGADVRAALGTLAGTRDYLVYADGLAPGDGTTGIAARPTDDQPGPANGANAGGYFAIVFGDGTPDFGVSHQTTAEHELLHTLGGVQDSAPHATGLGHCWQTVDVLCYDDGGHLAPGGGLRADCPGAAPTTVDCGEDDYFNPAPPAGSYLATHWDVYNSVFLCPPDACLAPGGNLAPVAAFTATATAADAGGLHATFDATASSDPDGSVASYAWDVDGDGVVDGTGPTLDFTYARPGTYTARLQITDNAGATARATRTIAVVPSAGPQAGTTAASSSRDPQRLLTSPSDAVDRYLEAGAARLRQAIRRAGGLRGLKHGRRVRVRIELPARGRLAARLDVGRRRVAATAVHTAPGRTVRLTLRLGRRARHRLPRRGRVDARLAFRAV